MKLNEQMLEQSLFFYILLVLIVIHDLLLTIKTMSNATLKFMTWDQWDLSFGNRFNYSFLNYPFSPRKVFICYLK